jgi:A/G-specific adenine glycosylase
MDPWFNTELIRWYRQNKRDLPWRNQKDPYRIWLSEIILQQTQVAQGLSYYLKFTKVYPQVKALAKASEDEVLKLWQGLGYYSRARNLHAAAKHIQEQLKGVFPSSYPDIRALKGVGDYTAAAIASFAYNLPHAVVDGNVYRLLSRVFGIETPIDSTAAKKEFQELANSLLNKKDPAEHNQAIMEFGSQYCRPVNPDCSHCVLSHKCLAFHSGKVALLPIKTKKTKVRNRFFNYVVLADPKKNIRLHRRGENDIWQGLYEFSLLETPHETSPEALVNSTGFITLCGKKHELLHVSKSYKHVLSHQHLYARFYVVRTALKAQPGQPSCKPGTLHNFAFPRLIEKFLNDCVLKDLF